MANTYVAIATVTVGAGGASSIAFSNIPQTYTDLLIFLSGRSTRTGTAQEVVDILFNGSYSNLSGIRLAGTGSSFFSGTGTYPGVAATDSATANTFGNCSFYIPNYTSSNNKSHSVDGVSENNATEAVAQLAAGLWSSSSAITSLSLRPQSLNNWTQYSTATLYGIKNS